MWWDVFVEKYLDLPGAGFPRDAIDVVLKKKDVDVKGENRFHRKCSPGAVQ